MNYEIIRSNRKTIAAEIRKGELIIKAPLFATNRDIRVFIKKKERWIKKHLAESQKKQKEIESLHKLSPEEIKTLTDRAKQVIPERVQYYAPLVGVKYGRITIRTQKTRWGSCSSKGNLNFNCLLMLTPPQVMDSVVVHELCHLKEMNHSQKFYAEVLRVFPEYRKWHGWLKENGDYLLGMIR